MSRLTEWGSQHDLRIALPIGVTLEVLNTMGEAGGYHTGNLVVTSKHPDSIHIKTVSYAAYRHWYLQAMGGRTKDKKWLKTATEAHKVGKNLDHCLRWYEAMLIDDPGVLGGARLENTMRVPRSPDWFYVLCQAK